MSGFRVASAHPESLTGGRMVGPGEEIRNLDETDPHNKRLIEEGKLVKLPSKKSTPRKRTTKKADEADKDTTTEGGDDE